MAFIYKNNPLNDGTYMITSKYGQRDSGFHAAIDLGTYGGAAEPIFSVADGVISYVGTNPNSGYGYYVDIDHGDGIITRYAHMKSVSIFSQGAKVSAGTTIGYVGSTGNSSGPHLHFEIIRNGTPIDPTSYINSGGTNIVNTDNPASTDPSNDSEDISPSNSYGSTSNYETSGLTVAQRVSGLTPQPVHPYVNIFIGDDLLLLSTEPPKPNILQLFEYSRVMDAGETASFVLFDDNWEEIEYVLANNFDRIVIEYGYWGNGLKSKKIRHRLMNYSISFEFTGTIISVHSVTEGVYENMKPRNIVLKTYNPTEAAKKICKDLGYKVLDENFDPSKDIESENPFNVLEDYPITYILDTIIPQAAQEGEEVFTFYIDEEGYAYFKRVSYNTSNVDNMRTYIWQKGYDSPVIDFVCHLEGVYGGVGTLNIESTARSTFIDTNNKHQQNYNFSKSSVVTYATGDASMMSSNQSAPLIDSSGYTAVQAKNRLYYRMKAPAYDQYKADMTIVGDPTIKLNELIRVINVTDSGHLHHTSGVYRVNKIVDTIQGGTMTTNLELVRNALYDIDGIELLNPKYYVK